MCGLVALVVLCSCVELLLSETSLTKLSEAPLLAPYDQNEMVDSFDKFNQSQRELIRSLFTPAFYDSKCELATQTIIQPVYYWPGETVRLRCVSCIQDFINNGVAKNWALLQNNIPELIEDLDRTLRIDKYGNEQWLILDEMGAEQMRQNLTTKSYIPGSSNDTSSLTVDSRQLRPQMTFMQRDGFLIINNTDVSNYGLYRCFDKESRFIVQFVYYLIPITPIYESVGFEEYSDECDNEQQKDFGRLDGFHQWRFFPRLLVNSNRTECAARCQNYTFDEAKLDIGPIALVRPESVDPEMMIHKFNLEIFVNWSNWSSCENNRTQRTRTGFCHIRKTDPQRVFQPQIDNIFKIYTWLLSVHRLLEAVDEFRREGLMLFSGVLGGLMLNNEKPPQHCTLYSQKIWDEMHKAIIDPLLEKTVNSTIADDTHLFSSLCFRKVEYADAKQMLFGHPLIQNESC